MRRDAEAHASEDKEKFELATLRNQADNMCYQLEKMMKEHAAKLTDGDKGPIEAAIKKTRDVAKGENTEAIKSAISELEQVAHAFSQTLYGSGRGGAFTGKEDDPGGQIHRSGGPCR